MATPEELAELLEAINDQPCDKNSTNITLSEIKNYLTIINNGGRGGALIARCTLTNDTVPDACVPATFAVSNFAMMVEDPSLYADIATPTTALNNKGYGLFGSGVGEIIYDWAGTWRVMTLTERTKFFVKDIEQTSNKGFRWHFEQMTTHTCDVEGTGTFLIETIMAEVLESIEKNGCAIDGVVKDVEVFSEAPIGTTQMVLFSEVVHLLGDVFINGCVVYGYYTPVVVPCSGTPYSEVLFYAEDICDCCDESGSGGIGEGDPCACCTDTTPSGFSVTINGVVAGTPDPSVPPDCCLGNNATFTLVQDAVDKCRYNVEYESCETMEIELAISCGGGNTTVTVTVGGPLTGAVFQKTFSGEEDCMMLSGDIPNTFTPADSGECDYTDATCTIAPIP